MNWALDSVHGLDLSLRDTRPKVPEAIFNAVPLLNEPQIGAHPVRVGNLADIISSKRAEAAAHL
jgi:hypothetical protein